MNKDTSKDIEPWQYVGDVNLVYGGTFFNLENWEHGYVDAVRVTDLDSGAGFDGAVLIEKITILLNPDYFNAALNCSGIKMPDTSTDGGKLQLAEALMSYGTFDPYQDYGRPWNEVVQTQEDGPTSFDGWKASKRVLENNLEGYVRAEWLD